ncbi:MAG: lipopolysaccharide biosynthesis protein [Cyanobacteriota bacterium]
MGELRRGWMHLAGGAGLGRVISFASNLALSRLLGPADLGLFNLVTTTVQTGDTLVRLGGDFAINYELGGEVGSLQTPRGRGLTAAFGLQNMVATAVMLVGMVLWLGPGHGLFPASVGESQRRLWSALVLLMVGLEACCAVPWEVLLVARDTRRLALRQGLFMPLRLILATVGAALGAITGALLGWGLVALIQSLWLACILRGIWPPPARPLPGWPTWRLLLRRGLPFYGANLVSSLVFFPLLLSLAQQAGLADVGFLRVGQILQQLFALLPGTLVPVLFLRLRQAENFEARMREVERVFRLLWFLLLVVLLGYGLVDGLLIRVFFGTSFLPSLSPTRMMLVTALLEVLQQILIQPLISSGQLRRYALLLNGGTLGAAVIGWILVPKLGLFGFLIAKYLAAFLPLLPLLFLSCRSFAEPIKLAIPTGISLMLSVYFSLGWLFAMPLVMERVVFGVAMTLLVVAARRDVLFFLPAADRPPT